jgi:uncharacterized protein (TIGR03435 family)
VTMPPDRTDRIEAGGISMAWLLDLIAEDLGRVVLDKTGFTAPFNLLLDFAPLRGRDLGSSSSGPTIFTALPAALQGASATVDALSTHDMLVLTDDTNQH